MENTPSYINGSTYTTRWLLGLFASGIALAVGIGITTVVSISSRLTLAEIQAATYLEKIKHLETISQSIMVDKIEYVTKYADLTSKALYTEQAIKLLEARTSSLAEKTLATSTRLDAVILFTDDLKNRTKGFDK